MKISGFSFIHNGIIGGFPFVEAIKSVRPYVDEIVIVDMESTDGTREVLQSMGVRVLDGKWGNQAGETLKEAHRMHAQCEGDIILHWEADEVYDLSLLQHIMDLIEREQYDQSVWRLQISQNFQKVRWYPEPVHRIFPKGSVIKDGHTTNRHGDARITSPENGFLWDCANIFRDNWKQRINAQAELWQESPQYRAVPQHFTHSIFIEEDKINEFLAEPFWTWKVSPLNIPEILRPLVGTTKYIP